MSDHEETPAQESYDWAFIAACLLALAVVAVTYANSLHNAFQFDDVHVIQNNLFIRGLGNIPHFFRDAATFSSLPLNATYRPVLTTSLALDYWLGGGLQPWQFHVTQLVLLVLLGVMLVFLFVRIFDMAEAHRWNRYAAVFTALLFTVHTANTETANYISARSEILAAIGVVGALLLYSYRPQSRRYHLYLIPMVLGALAKTSAVMFAPLLFVYILFFEKQVSVPDLFVPRSRRTIGKAFRASLPAFVLGLALFIFVESMNAPAATYGGGGRVSYLLTQSLIWLHYAKLFFLPVGLTADTDWGLISRWYDTQVVAGVVFLAVLGYIVWKSSKTARWRPVAFGIAWFALALLPTSSVFPLAEVANEHRVFFPFIGLSLAVVWAIGVRAQRWFDERPHLQQLAAPAAFVAAALVITGHAIGTHERNKVWASEESLWRDVVEKSPRNGRALMNYGLTQMSQGKFADARQLFERAQVLNPNYATLEINLGIVNGSMGAQALAEQHFLRALQLQSSDPNTHYYYARWLVNQGRAREAVPRLQEAIKLSPATVDARTLLMNVYYAAGADAELQALAKETLAISPNDPTASAYAGGASPLHIEPPTAQAYYARGLGFTQQGDHLNAAQAYREALKLDPKDPNFQNNFGWSRAKLGFLDESVPAFEEALRLKPDFALAKNNLAWVKAQLAARK